MQTVDVLRDDVSRLPSPDEFGDRAVAAIRFGLLKCLVRRDFAPPGLAAHVNGGNEVAKLDRLILCPEPAGAAEVGYAGLGAHASAGENADAAALLNHLAELFNQIGGLIQAHAPEEESIHSCTVATNYTES